MNGIRQLRIYGQELGNFVTPMMGRIIANAYESRALAQTRDLLLPKLISGEIRLSGAERAIKGVA